MGPAESRAQAAATAPQPAASSLRPSWARGALLCTGGGQAQLGIAFHSVLGAGDWAASSGPGPWGLSAGVQVGTETLPLFCQLSAQGATRGSGFLTHCAGNGGLSSCPRLGASRVPTLLCAWLTFRGAGMGVGGEGLLAGVGGAPFQSQTALPSCQPHAAAPRPSRPPLWLVPGSLSAGSAACSPLGTAASAPQTACRVLLREH